MKTSHVVAVAAAAVLSAAIPALAEASSTTTASATATAAVAKSWGPYYASAHRAKAAGKLRVDVADPSAVIPNGPATVSGKITDSTKNRSCGVAVFRITYLKADGTLPFKHRSYWACGYHKTKAFHFSDGKVYELELKVCSEGRKSAPSITCLYGGTWKVLWVGR
ncbi:hypothetical protein J5X84_27340 [Streptosporangiaceae bacterium NEAU-GS5]|nr:hypothetical protein [Streptosporangiaceae bacterium NEAU-GS5]